MKKNTTNTIIKFALIAGIFVLTTGQLGINCNRTTTDTDEGSLFQSTDSGLSYTPTVQTAGIDSTVGSLSATTIRSFPSDPSIVYLATTTNGLLRSLDRGKSWTELKDASNQMNENAQIYDIEFDPRNPNTMYAAAFQEGRGHVFKSSDRGQSWTESYVIPNENFAVYTIEVDPINTQNLYIGTAEGGLLQSSDAGLSWKLQTKLEGPIVDLAINPQAPSIVTAATTKRGVYQTIDSGATWNQIGKDELRKLRGANEIEHVIVDPNTPSTIYLTSKFGIVRSDDNGGTWSAIEIIPSQTQGVTSMVVQKGNSNVLYYGSGSIMYKSTDRGVNWTVRDLPSDQEVATIEIDAVNPAIIYVGMRTAPEGESAI